MVNSSLRSHTEVVAEVVAFDPEISTAVGSEVQTPLEKSPAQMEGSVSPARMEAGGSFKVNGENQEEEKACVKEISSAPVPFREDDTCCCCRCQGLPEVRRVL
jgi:hypothetical protein